MSSTSFPYGLQKNYNLLDQTFPHSDFEGDGPFKPLHILPDTPLELYNTPHLTLHYKFLRKVYVKVSLLVG